MKTRLVWCAKCGNWADAVHIGTRMSKPYDLPIWEEEVETPCCKDRFWIPCPKPKRKEK